MKKFNALTIREVRQETPEAVSILFDVPEELRDDYAYLQGQHITLKADVDGHELRRSYSVCSGVDDHELRIAIKKIEGGRFSGFANKMLKAGDAIEVFPPTGSFHTPLDADAAKSYAAFAGGSGITPVMSLIRTTLNAEPMSRFILIYGNRDTRGIIFAEALGKLKDKYLDRLEVYHVLEGDAQDIPLFQGLLTEEKCGQLLSGLIPAAAIDEFFICGPGPMMDSVEASLKAAGVDAANVHIERFLAAADTVPGAARKTTAQTDKAKSLARISAVIDGKKSSFDFLEGQDSLLEAATNAGLEVPYSCTGGVCATCRAKVVSGSVDMALNYGLEPDEIEKGFVLTCQSKPTSDVVELSYDA